MESETLLNVSPFIVLVSTVPLLLLSLYSLVFKLDLESKILVGTVRSFLQLAILGAILKPIFSLGRENWVVVVLYCFFMVVLASLESTTRCKYIHKRLLLFVTFSYTVNVSLLSIFAFVILLKPTPLWDPQYVIPVVGMLLGNGINGVSLAANAITTLFAEQSSRIEFWMSWGVDPEEAARIAVREAIRVGTLPILNSMAVIGLISIPGMMTGQILAGSSVLQASLYQMLICYLIASCSFGTILVLSFLLIREAVADGRLRENAFKKQKQSAYMRCILGLTSKIFGSQTSPQEQSESLCEDGQAYSDYGTSKAGNFQIISVHDGNQAGGYLLAVAGLSREVAQAGRKTVLFRDIEINMHPNAMKLIQGPSGTGKSQFLRCLARLSGPLGSPRFSLLDKHRMESNEWRRRVRYVFQKPTMPMDSTPNETLTKLVSLASLCDDFKSKTMSLANEMKMTMQSGWIDQPWGQLSGGEVQRIYVAMAIASRPDVLLLDESTNAVDLHVRSIMEKIIIRESRMTGYAIIWISHDEEQEVRLRDMYTKSTT